MPNILFETLPARHGKLGVITLNRPEALNALNREMIIDLHQQIIKWQHDSNISAVLIKSASTRAFCAGGDLKSLYKAGRQNYLQEIDLFRQEYNLNKLIYYYKKPYIALLDGITMGAGFGLSINGNHVIASEKLQLAMPETKIGLYPDVGATYFLGRCPHNLGMYLGLTGNIISVADAMLCGLVNNFVPSIEMNFLLAQLEKQEITEILKTANHNPGDASLKQHLALIEECFSHDSVEKIIAALMAKNSAFANELVAALNTRSPTSLKVTHKAITLGKNKTIDECLEMEFNLTVALAQQHDLYEGIRALLIDKTHDPKWQPASLKEVKDSDIDKMFETKIKL